mmetsp:Transcript_39297/g.44904  ORF Transcript_39297/g.44904 Transcript_39297/m.44904 type:complete len:266 (+) Transcript_39297:297-1094(+)
MNGNETTTNKQTNKKQRYTSSTTAIFTPSQGFFNFLVYIRPRILKYFAVQKKKKDAIKKRKAGEAAASCISTVSMVHVSGVEEKEVASNSVSNNDNTNGSDVMVEPSSTSIRSVPDGIITNNPHTPYARRSSNGSIKRLSNESGLSKLDESIDEDATEESPEEVSSKQQKRDSYSKVRFQVANIDVVDEEENPPSDSDMDSESKSLPSSPARAVGGGAAADGVTTTTTTTAAVEKIHPNNNSSFLELSTVLTKLTTQIEEDQKKF